MELMPRMPRSTLTPRERWSRAGLWALCAFTVFTLLGYASFGLHPALLTRVPPQVAGIYGIAFRLFAVGHVLIAGAVLFLFLFLYAGRRWLAAFAALYAISLSSELLGTSMGIPFGEYSYTPLLGAQWFSLVPVVIPLSWFFMALPSYALALRALPEAGQTARRVLLASLVLLSWDLALDPAMSYATKYWVWGEAGPYYGMPLLNLLGWERRRALDGLVPSHLEVPSGSRIPIDYADPDAPVLAARLQELFGMTETPRVAGGRVPLVIHLLSPAHRPVQVTRDLASFWKTGYFEVKKDLKGRYPKHYWPDDPLQAQATSRVRPRPGG